MKIGSKKSHTILKRRRFGRGEAIFTKKFETKG